MLIIKRNQRVRRGVVDPWQGIEVLFGEIIQFAVIYTKLTGRTKTTGDGC